MSTIGVNEVPARIGRQQLEQEPQPGQYLAPEQGVVMLSSLQRIEQELRRIRSFTPQYGRQFSRSDGGQLSAGGALTLQFEGPKSGADWYVERVSIAIGGASAAATVQLYASGAADESEWLDGLGALTGNSPSRGRLDGTGTPYFIYGGGPICIVVAGGVASQQALVRVQGREVLSGLDPALRGQERSFQ